MEQAKQLFEDEGWGGRDFGRCIQSFLSLRPKFEATNLGNIVPDINITYATSSKSFHFFFFFGFLLCSLAFFSIYKIGKTMSVFGNICDDWPRLSPEPPTQSKDISVQFILSFTRETGSTS